MSGTFKPRHVVTMVVAICIAAVLGPVAVWAAATGQPMNIVDPVDVARMAKVNSMGRLMVESQPGNISNVLHASFTKTVAGASLVASTGANTRYALTQLTFAASGPNAGQVLVHLTGWRRFSGTNSCAHVVAGNTAGFSPLTLRMVTVPVGQTIALHFPGPALMSNGAPSGHVSCLVLNVPGTPPSGFRLDAGITGYSF